MRPALAAALPPRAGPGVGREELAELVELADPEDPEAELEPEVRILL